MAKFKDTYFLVFNDPSNPQGGTSFVAANGFGLLLGATGSVNFGNRTPFFHGLGDRVDPYGSSILGGDKNALSGDTSVLVGGQDNRVIGTTWAFLGAGRNNTNCGGSSFIGAGQYNTTNAGAAWSFIGGGAGNKTWENAATIAGGEDGDACSYASFIGGGRANSAGDSFTNGWYASVTAGFGNCSAAFGSHIDAGESNYNSGCWSIIAGGVCNKISGSKSCENSIVGGSCNSINASTGNFGFFPNGMIILGGKNNSIEGYSTYSSIIGSFSSRIQTGQYNFIAASNNNRIFNLANSSVILGGTTSCIDGCNGNMCFNTIINSTNARILGTCSSLIINSPNSRICCGSFYSNIIGGQGAIINIGHTGASLLTDGQSRAKISSGPHTLTLDFASGIFIKNKTILQNSYIPSDSTSPGTSGQIATDSNYFYSHNGIKWLRTALSEW